MVRKPLMLKAFRSLGCHHRQSIRGRLYIIEGAQVELLENTPIGSMV